VNEQMFSAGFTEDVRQCAGLIKGLLHEGQPLIALGYSLGANILTKYLGEEGAATPVTAAVNISNPLDLNRVKEYMCRRTQRAVYNPVILKGLVDYYGRNEAVLRSTSKAPSVEEVEKCRSVHEFDTKVVVPLFGYRDLRHYYDDASSARLLHNVAVPLLLVDADDDVITGAPYRDPEAQAAVDRNPNLIFALTKTGGHVGHLQFPPLRFWRALTWSDAVVMQFVEAVRQRPCLSRPATR